MANWRLTGRAWGALALIVFWSGVALGSCGCGGHHEIRLDPQDRQRIDRATEQAERIADELQRLREIFEPLAPEQP